MKELFMIGVGAASYQQRGAEPVPRVSAPFLGASRKTGTAAGMGAAVVFVVHPVVSDHGRSFTAVFWCRLHVEYLQTIVFILIIAALVQFVEMALKKYSHALL